MLARNETLFKWSLYAGATALCFLAQSLLLQRITLLGVIPFLYPILVAALAVYEGPFPGTVYALCVGVLCDLLLPVPLPCFHTLIFPPAALCAALISLGLLPAGPLCVLTASAAAFAMTGLFHGLVLWVRGQTAWAAVLSVCGREFLVSVLLVLPVTLLIRAVYRKTHIYD